MGGFLLFSMFGVAIMPGVVFTKSRSGFLFRQKLHSTNLPVHTIKKTAKGWRMFEWLWELLGRVVFFTGAIVGKNSYPKPLTKEEEEKYLALTAKGDKGAKETLIKHNMRLVVHIAKKYSGVAESDDLISVGSIGLIKAISTYKAGKGTTLSTYTARCIENEILMMLRSNKKHRNTLSLSDPIGVDKDGNELTFLDLLFEEEDCVYGQVERAMVGERLLRELKTLLTEREFGVICLRFGLKNGVPMPQREVAQLMKISRSYISRIEKKAIEKLRKHLRREDYYD